MSNTTIPLDVAAAEEHLMRFLSVEGVTGQEAAIAAAVSDELKKVGVPASAIRFDDANKRIPLPTETGNLIVDLPGTRRGPRLLFSTHLDTVPLCAGAKPKREGDRIVSDGTTALGGDNRTGCAVLVDAGRDAAQAQAPAPADHAALHRARGERPARRPRTEPGGPRRRGDVLQRRRQARRRADHRRGRPGELGGRDHRQGVPCRRRPREGHLGDAGRRDRARRGAPRRLVRQGGRSPTATGTSNVGIFGGKDGKRRRRRHQRRHRLRATSRARRAARRRRSPRRSPKATARPSRRRKREVKDAGGGDRGGEVQAASPPIRRSSWQRTRRRCGTPSKAAESLGLKPTTLFSNGGLDANWLDKHGIPTVTIGAGQYEIHTVKEYVDLPEFARAAGWRWRWRPWRASLQRCHGNAAGFVAPHG